MQLSRLRGVRDDLGKLSATLRVLDPGSIKIPPAPSRCVDQSIVYPVDPYTSTQEVYGILRGKNLRKMKPLFDQFRTLLREVIGEGRGFAPETKQLARDGSHLVI